MNSLNDRYQLPVGLTAQLVEYDTGVHVRDFKVQVTVRPDDFRAFFHHCLRSVQKLRPSLQIFYFIHGSKFEFRLQCASQTYLPIQ